MAALIELKLSGEKFLHQGTEPRLVAYCPSMELLALGSTDQQVTVYRLNGQKVYATTQKGKVQNIERICWKPNGQLLAVAWSDGIVRLVGAESNKVVHQLPNAVENSTGITCLAWVSNTTSKKRAGQWPSGVNDPWRNVLETRRDFVNDDGSFDLPQDLSVIDIESSLPKLSALPAGGTSEDVFSSQASLDGLFRVFDPKDNNVVDVLVVGTRNGSIHLSIYDSFFVGSFTSPLATSDIGDCESQLLLHASHKLYSTHALLMSSSSHSRPEMYYIPMDLRFISSSSDYLSLLASRSTALQNLLRYIHQVQNLMASEWRAAQDLPSKFLKNVNETLRKKNKCDIVQALYHSVATGHIFPAVKEWLMDELAERGHKRWDKAVTSGLENIRTLVHENMLPALDRSALILSRLSGIVRYQGPSDTLGFSSRQVDLVMETVACLKLVALRILAYVMDELDLFTSFSGWLRNEIDVLASDTSSTLDDALEKEVTIDHGKVLRYIQTAMTTSRLSVFFQEATASESMDEWVAAGQGLSIFKILDKQLRRHHDSLPYTKTLPSIEIFFKYLDQQASGIFQRIADAEKKNVLFGQPVRLGEMKMNGSMALILCPKDAIHCKAYVALVDSEQFDKVHIFCIQTQIKMGISNMISIEETAVSFGGNEIRDISFSGNCNMVVLHSGTDEKPSLLSIPCRNEDGVLSYHPSPLSATTVTAHNVDEIQSQCLKYAFPQDSFVPDKFELSRRSQHNHKSNSSRLCVLDRGRLHYRIFSLPEMNQTNLDADEDVSMP